MEGRLAFTRGFLAAAAVAGVGLRIWPPTKPWKVADGMALGLTVGLAIGRVGCLAVGEHLGGPTGFHLGDALPGRGHRGGPLSLGVTYHNTALYELLHLALLALVLWWLVRPGRARPGTGMVVFGLRHGLARFGTDFLRVDDRQALGLTGAHWACLGLLVAATWATLRLRARPV